MSKTIPIALLEHKAQAATTLCDIIRIGPVAGGAVYGFASLDRDVVYDDGDGEVTYYAHTGINASAQMAAADIMVDGAEVETLVATYTVPGVTQDAVDRGIFDKAPFVIYRVNYEDLTQGHEVIASGTIGEQAIKIGGVAILEPRGLSQQMMQSVVELDSLTCRVKKFGSQPGDERFPCGYDLAAEWVSFTVSEVGLEPTRQFRALELVEADDYFAPGIVEWETGDNAGQVVEIEQYNAQADVYVSVLNFEQSDIDDEGGHAWSAFGGAALVTTWAAFGLQSLRLDGAGDYISAPDSDDWHFGAGEFTAELRVRFSGAPANAFLIGQWGATAAEQAWVLYLNGNVLTFLFREASGGGTRTATAAWAPAALTAYHVAVSRDAAGVVRIFVDGAIIASASLPQPMNNGTATLNIGANAAIGGGYDLNGWVDAVAICRGDALYTAAFAPPTTAPTNLTGGLVTLQFTLPDAIAAGDTGRLRRDCSRAWSGHNSCETYFGAGKGLRFRGEPYIPVGEPAMIPGASA